REHRHHEQEDEPHLDDRFLDRHAQVASNQHLDQQQQYHTAVENRNRQQIEDREVETHDRHQAHERRHAFFRRLTRERRHSDWTLELLGRHTALENSLEELEDHRRALDVLANRFLERVRKGQLGRDQVELLVIADTYHPAGL